MAIPTYLTTFHFTTLSLATLSDDILKEIGYVPLNHNIYSLSIQDHNNGLSVVLVIANYRPEKRTI